MTGPFMSDRVEELVHRSHCDHVTDLAAAALIEQHGRFLLAQGELVDTPRGWHLPTGPVWPGETVVDGLHRILAQGFGSSDAEITAFLGVTDADSGTRTFVFAVSTSQPDSICRDGRIPHRWNDNITISDEIPEINPVLRTYYASEPG
jgi:hypothetical protein